MAELYISIDEEIGWESPSVSLFSLIANEAII